MPKDSKHLEVILPQSLELSGEGGQNCHGKLETTMGFFVKKSFVIRFSERKLLL